MSKPLWRDAPEDAKFLAQDRDGDWYWWSQEPVIAESLDYWMPGRGNETPAFIVQHLEIVEGWKESLEARP